ncbi:MAG: IS21 family transposase [Acidimicrobiales bacterium]
MPNRRISMRGILSVLALHAAGHSVSEIHRETGVSRRTVYRYIERAATAGLPQPLGPEETDASVSARLFPAPLEGARRGGPVWEDVHRELTSHRHLTMQQMWKEYKETTSNGVGYSHYCARYRAWRARTKVTMVMQRVPGEKLFVDFAGDTVPIWDSTTGKVAYHAKIFVAAMGVSNLIYTHAFANEKVESWIAGGTGAFEYMKAVPHIVVPDNAKAAVITPSRHDPLINADYLKWARHYGTTIVPARVRKPRDKASVEGSVLLVERHLQGELRAMKYFSLHDLNLDLAAFNDDMNSRPFQAKEGSRRQVFDEADTPQMLPLRAERYEHGIWKQAKVQMNYHIRHNYSHYSVPYTYAAHKVDVRVTQSTVEIYANGIRIASHQIQRRKGMYSTVHDHMPSAHQAQGAWNTERILSWLESSVGPNAQQLSERLIAQSSIPEHAYNGCLAIQRLSSSHTPQRVEAACARALHFNTIAYRSVKSILDHGLDALPLIPETPTAPIVHSNLRGEAYYAQFQQSFPFTKEPSC